MTVVDFGSINKAAEHLFITQPALSRILKSLEEEMGKTLLIRQNHGVSPTREGKLLYTYAQTVLAELKVIEHLKHKNAYEIFSELHVSIYSLFVCDRIFSQFVDQCQADNASLCFEEVTIEELLNNLYHEKSEIGIAAVHEVEFNAVQKMMSARRVHYELIGESPMYVHVGKNHPLYDQEKIELAQLFDTTYLHLPFDSYSNLRLSMNIDGVTPNDFKKSLTVNNYHLLANILKEKDCFLFGNKWQIDELKKLGIRSKPIKRCDNKIYLLILTPTKYEELSQEGRIFVDLIRDIYQSM